MRQMKAWVICDPYAANSTALLKSFDTKAQAQAWLLKKLKADADGYVECHVLPRDEAMANYA